jgi:hypothetical protein|tara:strand:+ start:362 stop:610 length:249 start_codon:yes stop_codon:yes gene_type:complete
MGKVKQAIQEVQEIVYWYVQGNRDITLPEVQTLLFKKHWHKNDNGYFLDEKIVKNAYNKAIWERDNEEEYELRTHYQREEVL